jgi:TPP-dependent 2-oxoacid decarboxylase
VTTKRAANHATKSGANEKVKSAVFVVSVLMIGGITASYAADGLATIISLACFVTVIGMNSGALTAWVESAMIAAEKS